MASSLNGLSVGDSLVDNIMESPARSENTSYFRYVCSDFIYIFLTKLMNFVCACSCIHAQFCGVRNRSIQY